MTLDDFEKYIEDKILSRGLDYYKSGCVVSLEYDEDDGWIADVEGSEDYTVTVVLSDSGEILETDCDCPYDWGPYCKHQAAVFYALRNRSKQNKTPSTKTQSKAKKKKSLEEALKNLDKQTLLSVILDFAGRDRRMKEELLLRYGEKNETLQSARGVIQSAINAVERRGFVEYSDVNSATDGADTVLEMVGDNIDSGDIMAAVSLGIIVLEEMMELLGYCDDSNGYVGGTIDEGIVKIGEAVDAIPPDHADSGKVFDMVFDHALSGRYNGWTDWRMDLLSKLISLCGSRVNRDKLEKYLSEQQNAAGDGWSRKFENQQLQDLQYKVLKKFDGEAAASGYMEQHLDNDDFRSAVIQKAISKRQYEKALKLCLEGEQTDSHYAGLVKKWKEYRYAVYEKTKDIPSQKALALDLLLDGDFKYFSKLKALYTPDEWPAVLQNILEQLGDSNRHGVYVDILIHENLKLRLLEYCKKHVHNITDYYKHLVPECKNDVGLIFVEYIRARAMHANGRNHYRETCEIIRHYKKACGKEAAYAIRDELKEKFPRRPAFLDELRKV